MNKGLPSKHFLRDQVATAMLEYFSQLEGGSPAGLYELVLNQVEPPLLKSVLSHTKGNQTLAAKWLGLNRGTLRKLLAKYQLA
jgi:Fis family transcriptional regulator